MEDGKKKGEKKVIKEMEALFFFFSTIAILQAQYSTRMSYLMQLDNVVQKLGKKRKEEICVFTS